MGAFFATLRKELLLLSRDRGGLALLFLMPMVLVLVVSLVQDNVLKLTGEGSIRVLLVDRDGGESARRLVDGLKESGAVQLVQAAGDAEGEAEARRRVAAGDFPFALVIPAGLGEELERRAEALARRAFAANESPEDDGNPLELAVYFDPAVQGAFRATLINALQRAALSLEVAEKGRQLGEVLPRQVAEQVGKALGPYRNLPGAPAPPAVTFAWQDRELLAVRAEIAAGKIIAQPDSVQQNVPAWTLFGMFFIVVPLSGALLRERQEGTLQRLLSLPVSGLPLLGGKLAAYVLVGCAQALVMLLVGRLLLPRFGTPTLQFGGDLPALILLILACALAATGYGMLIGTLVRSYEQAAMLGPVSIVLAAALGGIMVPVYAMPPAMQSLSILSPLAWGLEGFIELFVRHGDLARIAPQLASLLLFATACLGLAWLVFARRRSGGR